MTMPLSATKKKERLAFLRRRQFGIGGSDMPVILGLSTFVPQGRSNPLNCLDVYFSKTRPIREEDIEDDNIHQMRGHAFEEMALAHYIAKTERDCVRVSEPTSHPDYPNVIVSRDFQIEPDESREEGKRGRGTGETKSPISKVFGKVIESGLRQSELIQLQTNIAASQDEWGSFCYFNMEHNSGPVIAVDQLANPDMGEFLLKNGQRFWDEHVVPRIPPIPSEWKLLEGEAAPIIVDMSGELQIIEDDIFTATVVRLLDRKDNVKKAKEQFEETKQEVFQYLTEFPCPECGPDEVGLQVECERCDGTGLIGLGKAQIPELARLTVVTKKGQTSRNWAQLQDSLPLDRDKVERWLREWDSRFGGEWEADLGRLLFECIIDLSVFETVGNPTQYLLPNRMAK